MDAGLATMIFMGLILKIPVAAACWLIWHAVRAEPEPASSDDGGGGIQPHREFRRDPRPKRPPRPGPRRGPHAPGALPIPCPEEKGSLRVARPAATPRIALAAADEHRA